MRAILSAIAVLAAGPAHAQGFSGLEADVVDGFVSGVIDGCIAAAEANKSLDQLGSPLFVSDPVRMKGFEPRADSVGWAPKIAQGAVTIDVGPEFCSVNTYAIPIASTLDDIVATLRERGYEERNSGPAEPKTIKTNLVKKFARWAVVISLSGMERDAPGASSGYSMATAVISVVTY